MRALNFIKAHNAILLLLLLPTFCLFGMKKDNEVRLKVNQLSLRIVVVTPSIVRISITENKDFSNKSSLTVIPLDGKINFKEAISGNIIRISTDSLTIELKKNDGTISFFDKNHKRILEAVKAETAAFTRTEVEGENVFQIRQYFHLTKDEALYGLGQYEDPVMNYRGHDVLISQANRTDVNPFIVSTNGYGLLWNNYSESKFHDVAGETYFWSEVADEIDYYFVYGPTIDDEIAGYRKLTEDAPMFGKWAYGYWQSKERYQSANELIGVVKEYREREIPLDNIVQDW